MKKMIRLVILLMLILVGYTGQVAAQTPYRKLTTKEAKMRMDQADYDMILDVRPIEAYRKGHIKNAISLPASELDRQEKNVLKDKNAVIFVYCTSGKISKNICEKLIRKGYTQVYDLGGIVDWPYEML